MIDLCPICGNERHDDRILCAEPGKSLDLGIVRDVELNRTNDFHLFYESFVSLADVLADRLNEFGKAVAAAVGPVIRLVDVAVYLNPVRAAINRGIPESDIRSAEVVDRVLVVKLYNWRTIRYPL